MTPKELMVPRYRNIRSYPNSTFPVGQIVQEWEVTGWKFSDYPEIFTPIHWYKWRGENELPEYVKFTWAGEIQKIEKVESWIRNDIKDDPYEEVWAFTYLFDERPLRTSLNDACVFSLSDGWFPATKEEHEKSNTK